MAFVSHPFVTRSPTATPMACAATSAVIPGAFVPASRSIHRASPQTIPVVKAAPHRPTTLMVAQPNIAIVTGASSSIGLHAAKTLAQRGYHVVMAVRNIEKAQRVARDVGIPADAFTTLELDLSSLDSVRSFAKAFQASGFSKLDALVCNAATWHPRDKAPRFTVDGFDETVQVNHLGHFLLANLLLPLINLAKGRIVFLATQTHNPDTLPGKIPPQADLGDLSGLDAGFNHLPGTIDGKKFEPTKAYKDSKVCNVLTMQEMDRRFSAGGATFTAIFPGCIAESDLFREKRGWFRWFFPLFQRYITKQYVSVEEAGRRVALVASDGRFGDSGTYWQWRGSYLEGTDKTEPVPIETNERESVKAEQLWELSAKLVGIPA